MSSPVNGHYSSPEQAKNVWEDLIASGIPRDNIYIDEDNQMIKVLIPETERREIQEIFDRHKLS